MSDASGIAVTIRRDRRSPGRWGGSRRMTVRNAARTLAVAVAALAPAAVAEAHSGGLDSNCGHAGSRPYHFHLDGPCGARLRARQALQEPERGIDRSDAEWRAAKAAAPVVEDGATFRSDLWLLARHGSWTSGTDEDARGVIAVTEDGLRLEVHCSPGDDEGRPEHANWLAAVISDAGEYFVSGPPEDRRAALLIGTGARMIAQAAARGRQPLEIHLGSERKTFPTAGADRAAARALEPGTACDWSSDTDLTFDAPSTEGLRAGGMALAGDAAAAPADQPVRTRLDDALLWGIGVAMISGGFLVGVAGVCCWWRERAAQRQRPEAVAVRRAEPPRDPNRPMPSPASPDRKSVV